MATCPGTGKMPKLTCPREGSSNPSTTLESSATYCNDCARRLKAIKQRREKNNREDRR